MKKWKRGPKSEQISTALSIKTIAEGMRGRAVCQSRSPQIEFDSGTTNDDRAKTQIWKQMRRSWEGSGRAFIGLARARGKRVVVLTFRGNELQKVISFFLGARALVNGDVVSMWRRLNLLSVYYTVQV